MQESLRNFLKLFGGGVLFVAVSWAGAVRSTVLDQPTQQALDALNAARREIGLGPVRVEPALLSAADAHARYMSSNNLATHTQISGNPGFIAVDATARGQAFGYKKPVAECVARADRTPAETVAQFFAAPYHRLPLIRPGEIDFGCGFAGEFSCMNFGVFGEPGNVITPGDGQSNVPISWDGVETPNPLAIHGVSGEVGYPIVLACFYKKPGKIGFSSAELTGPDGKAVSVLVNHPGNDSNIKTAIFVIPSKPLLPSSSYSITIKYTTIDETPAEASATFTTASR